VRRSGGEGRVDPRFVLVVDGFARLHRVVGVEAEDVIGDPLRLGRGVEDFAPVPLQNVKPGLKVIGVVGNVGSNSKY
jgi:hypothetical protein